VISWGLCVCVGGGGVGGGGGGGRNPSRGPRQTEFYTSSQLMRPVGNPEFECHI